MLTQSDRDRQQEFLHVFEPQRHALWRFVRSMVRTDEDAQDLMSETILQTYQSFHRIRDHQAFVSYVFTVAHRLIKRHNWRRRLFAPFDDEIDESAPSHGVSPDVQTDIILLRQALLRLPERTREAVVLFEILGFSIREISDIQSSTESAVKSRLKRGRSALAALLGVQEKSMAESPLSQTSFTQYPVL